MHRLSLLLSLALFLSPLWADTAATASQKAHDEIWRRFIDKYGIMIDFADMNGEVSLPTPEECREGKPNALGWWAPIENGAMFNGLYMDAAVNRWQRTKSAEDAEKARKLMQGLLLLNSISDVKGFVGRGVSTDGKSHYPMGSNDQTLPWFLGLWRYWQSGIATEAEKAKIMQHLVTTAEEIVRLGWKMPAEQPFGTRGSFEGFHFEEVSRKLFTMRALHAVTGDKKWQTMYLDELAKRGGEKNLTKREICEGGMVFWYSKTHNWTSCAAVGALRGHLGNGERCRIEVGLCQRPRRERETGLRGPPARAEVGQRRHEPLRDELARDERRMEAANDRERGSRPRHGAD